MINITVGSTVYPVPSGASDTNWASRLVAILQALAAANAVPLTWVAATGYGAGWSGNLEYAKDPAGRVWWRGTATHAGSIVSIIFNPIPATILPPTTSYFACIDQNAGGHVAVEFTTGGIVVPVLGPNGSLIDFGQVFYDTHAF